MTWFSRSRYRRRWPFSTTTLSATSKLPASAWADWDAPGTVAVMAVMAVTAVAVAGGGSGTSVAGGVGTAVVGVAGEDVAGAADAGVPSDEMEPNDCAMAPPIGRRATRSATAGAEIR